MKDPATEGVDEATDPSTSAAVSMTSAAIAAAIKQDDASEPETAAPPPSTAEAPESPAEPAASAPSTPVKAALDADVEVVVHTAPTPAAIKFMDTMSDVGAKVGKLESTEISDGMYELSRRCSTEMKSSYSTFSSHALDLAIVASSDPQPDQTRFGALRQQTEWKKIGMLPLAAVYALIAAVCMMVFAVIYYPKLYGPKMYELAKAKAIEHKVDQHAMALLTKVREKSSQAYVAAKESEFAAKGFEYFGKATTQASAAYSAAAATPVAIALSTKSSELAAKGRSKLAEKLVALRDGQPSTSEPEEPQTPV